MEGFEELLAEHRISVERYVRFRLSAKQDADDVLQEIYLTAYRRFDQLKNPASFKAWLISVARSKCNDYFREKAVQLDIPLEDMVDQQLSVGRSGLTVQAAVRETLHLLGDKDKQILYLFFWKNLPQAEIAKRLSIPVGTVKSRLHTAKKNFKSNYPLPPKGANHMKKLPEFLPEYKIEESSLSPFSVKWEELMGWFLIPKLGEQLSWGMYDLPSRKCDRTYEIQATSKAIVHGIEGVEITVHEKPCSNKEKSSVQTFVAQLTDTHCRYLASAYTDGDVRNYITFLDSDAFLPNWGIGEDNCGNEIYLSVKGDIKRSGSVLTTADKPFMLDIVGRYIVTIHEKSYDTVCMMYMETGHSDTITEQFLDQNGRTILWRRFNRNDWALDRYKQPWTELLPDNERLTVNGATYVHWYDCITDYIL